MINKYDRYTYIYADINTLIYIYIYIYIYISYLFNIMVYLIFIDAFICFILLRFRTAFVNRKHSA